MRPIYHFAQKHWAALVILVFSIFYFCGTIGFALAKPFWFDELITVYISRLPTFSDIYGALQQSIDFSPPLIHLFTRLANLLPANELVTNRLPAIIGHWILCLCLYVFVSRRCPKPYAIAAMLAPVITVTHLFAYEARPYGLVLGLVGLTLVCWQAAAENHNRLLALIGLTLSLTLAIAGHYLAVSLVYPIGAGELVRAYKHRRVDWGVMLALGLAVASLVFHIPLIRSAGSHLTAVYTEPLELATLLNTYRWFSEGLLPGLALTTLSLFLPVLHFPKLAQFDLTQPILKLPTLKRLAMVVSLVVIPIAALLLFTAGDERLSLRYLLLVIVGLIITGLVVAAQTDSPEAAPQAAIPLHETMMALALTTLPIILMLAALTVTHLYGTRYALYGSLGFMILTIYLVAHFETRKPLTGVILMLTLAVFAGLRLWEGSAKLFLPPTPPLANHSLLQTVPNALPIAVASPIDFLPIYYQAPPTLRSQLIYLTDAQASINQIGFDSSEISMFGLRNWVDVRVADYSAFLATTPEFLVYETQPWWLINQLLKDGADIKLLKQQGITRLYQVTLPAETSP